MISEKEYKSPLSFPGTGYEMVTCHYPLRLDTYSGCVHDCVYCYAKSILSARKLWSPEFIKMANINKIEKKFEYAFMKNGRGAISEALRHKLPLRLGGLTDCFQEDEVENGMSLKLLSLLNKYDYPYMIVTKSDIVAREEYLKHLCNGKAYVQVTVVSLNNGKVQKIEPGAPNVHSRINAIKKLSNNNVFVCARLSPVIPKLSTNGIKRYVDRMAQAGIKHILVEFFRGSRKRIEELESLLEISFMDLMEKKGAYYRVNSDYKMSFYEKVRSLCVERGLGFSICSDGDLVPINLNTTVNCCGTDTIPGFENYSSCTANTVVREAYEKNRITLSEMKRKYWSPDFNKFVEAWHSGRIAQLVKGIEKKGNAYVKGTE